MTSTSSPIETVKVTTISGTKQSMDLQSVVEEMKRQNFGYELGSVQHLTTPDNNSNIHEVTSRITTTKTTWKKKKGIQKTTQVIVKETKQRTIQPKGDILYDVLNKV
jgi:hypothetical protein